MAECDRILCYAEMEGDEWNFDLANFPVLPALSALKVEGHGKYKHIILYNKWVHSFLTERGHRWDCLNGWTR